MLNPGYIRSAYGDPDINGFVPATILVEISKTLNYSLSDTTVSKQNGPHIPPKSSYDLLTIISAILNAFGSKDSRITTGALPVTTNDG